MMMSIKIVGDRTRVSGKMMQIQIRTQTSAKKQTKNKLFGILPWSGLTRSTRLQNLGFLPVKELTNFYKDKSMTSNISTYPNQLS